MIKQESDESGIVTEFQGNGPLLKKIKQEVSLRSFERNRLRMLFPLFLIDKSASSLWNNTTFLTKVFIPEAVQIWGQTADMWPVIWGAKPLLSTSCLNKKHAGEDKGMRRKEFFTYFCLWLHREIIDTNIFNFQMSWRTEIKIIVSLIHGVKERESKLQD